MFSYLVGTTKRLLLFSFFFLFAYLKYSSLDKSSYDFKDKVFEFTTIVNFKNAQLEKFLEKPERGFQMFLIFQTGCALLAVLGSRFFSFLAALCLMITNILYFSPMRINPATKKSDVDFKNLNLDLLKSLSWEFIVLSVLSLAILTQSFRSSCFKRCETLPKEAGVTESPNSKRDAKVSSKKKKKI